MNEGNIVDKVAGRLTLDISPALTQLQTLSTEVTKALGDAHKAVTSGPRSSGDVYLADATGAIRTLRQQLKELELQFKEGQLAADDYFNKLQGLRQTYGNALDTTTSTGLINDQALRSALLKAQDYVRSFEDGTVKLDQDSAAHMQQIRDEALGEYQADVDAKVKQVKFLHDMQVQSAQDSADQLATIYAEDYSRFAADEDKKMSLLKQMNAYQAEADKQAMAASYSAGPRSTGSIFNSSHSSRGYGGYGHIGLGNMATMMAEFTGISMLTQNIMTGLVDITKQQQGLEQVFGTNIHSQQQLNEVTNQFIDIAEKYGASVTDVLDASKQWGRQYHDIATAQALVNSSTLLSIVDNLKMTDSAKALEATMNALGMSVSNAAEAQKSSMQIVDQWANMAHNASVSANDLAGGVERSAGAAKQAGLSLAQLNALIAAGVRNSGESGDTIGTMWKTVLAKISSDTPKIQKAFQTLGISMQNANGSMRPVYDLIVQMSQKSGDLDAAQKAALMTITGGVRQYSRFAQAISNVNTIQNDYQIALNSTGKASQYMQEQLHTLSAELQRLRDEIQKMAYNAGSGGLGTTLAGMVRGITDLIAGLQKLPAWLDTSAAAVAGVFLGVKMLNGMWNTFINVGSSVRSTLSAIETGMQKSLVATMNMAGGTQFLTADLNAKIIAEDASIVADEAQTAASAETSIALTEEGNAARGASTGFDMLDVASGGLTLALGVIVGVIAYVATGMGRASESSSQLDSQIQQLNSQLQSQNTILLQNVDNLQNLANSYAKAKQTMDSSQQGSAEYKQAQQEVADIERQLIQLVGQKTAEQILSSKDVVAAIEAERQVQVQQAVEDEQNTITSMENDAAKTQQFIDNTQKRIEAMQAEANSQSSLNNSMMSMQAGLGSSLAGAFTSTSNPNRQEADALTKQLAAYEAQLKGQNEKIAAEQNVLAQNKIALEQLKKSPSVMLQNALGGTGAGSGLAGGGSGAGTKKGKSGSSGNPFANQEANDQAAIDRYKAQIDASTFAIQAYKDELSNASNELKRNNADTQAAQNYSAAYGQEISSLTTNIRNYNTENAAINGMLTKLDGEMSGLEARYKSHEITTATYSSALKSLESEYKNLTNTVKQNASAVMQDKSAMVSATEGAVSEVVNLLQQGYQAEQKIQEDRLQNIYQPQLDALNAQKTAIDDQIKSLQALWNAQAQTNNITDLQNQLANVKGQLNQEIVGPDGKLTYTYDTAKAASLQKQLDDAITKQQHDAQIQQLQDQSNALQTQIKNLTDAYDTEKKQLDDYWSYRLNADTLQTEAEAAIMQEGFTKALNDAQTFAVNMGNALQTLQMPNLLKGEDAARKLGLTNATNAISQFVNATNAQFQQVQADFASKMGLDIAEKNVQQFVGSVNNELSKISAQPIVLNVDVSNATSALQGLANAANNAVSAINKSKHGTILNPAYIQWDAKAYDAMHKGIPMTDILKSEPKQKWLTFSTGGEVPFGAGMPGRDSVPAMLTPGEYVVPQPTMEDIWANVKGNASHTTSAPVYQFTGDINLPNVTDAESFKDGILEFAHGFANYTRGA